MKLKKVMVSMMAMAMLAGTATSVNAATELSFWTLNTRQDTSRMAL